VPTENLPDLKHRKKLIIPRFRNIIVAILYAALAIVSLYILKYDYVLQMTPNAHWYVLVGFTAVDLILGLQLFLTGLLRVWDRFILRVAGAWSLIVLFAIVLDVVSGLQLRQGYPQVSQVDAFEYLFLGINGNSVPLGTPVLFALYAAVCLLCFLPRDRRFFDWASFPTWRTLVGILLIGIVVLGARPTFLMLRGSLAPNNAQLTSTSSQTITIPEAHVPLPFDASNRTIYVTLVSEASSYIPYNFNDTQYGHLVVYLPSNWTLSLVFINREGITHNAVLIKPDVQVPTFDLASDGIVLAQIPQNALAGKFLVSGQSGSAVIADLSPGTYWVACAMSFPTPHAESGMWVTLEVSDDVASPYYVLLT
jgi:sulfocyanin